MKPRSSGVVFAGASFLRGSKVGDPAVLPEAVDELLVNFFWELLCDLMTLSSPEGYEATT